MWEKIVSKFNDVFPGNWNFGGGKEGAARYLANTGWLMAGQAVSLAAAFFIGTWLARYLGPENYGILNYAVAFSGLFSILASWGLDGILNRELIRRPEERDVLLGTAFRLKIFGGIVALFAAVAAAAISKEGAYTILLVSLISLSFILQAYNVIGLYFQGQVQARASVKVQVIATLASSILKMVIIMSGGSLTWVALVYGLDTLWMGIGSVISYRQAHHYISDWSFSRRVARDLLRDSWPMFLAGAAMLVYLKIDQVIVGRLLGDWEVGIYAAASKLSEAWYFLPTVICTSLFPAIMNAKKISAGLYRRRLTGLYLLLIILATVIAVVITIFSHQLVYFLFGPEYWQSELILRIYIWSGIGFFWGSAATQYLMAENLVKTSFMVNAAAMVANIFLNFLLIPKLGLSGAAWATLIAYFLMPALVGARQYFQAAD